ncbi:MAG: VWA domain-containing protein [Myxococcota bacterium]
MLDAADAADAALPDANTPDANTPDAGTPDAAVNPGTVISFGGSQDFAYFRQEVEGGRIPLWDAMDSPGFFAEHHTSLPPPTCGNSICIQGLVGARENLINNAPCTVMQIGLNSPKRIEDLQRKPRRLMLVIDESGSMVGNNLTMLRAGLTLMGQDEEMTSDDQFALVTFGDAVGDVVDWQPFTDDAWNTMVENLAADEGSTNIYAGLMKGLELLAEGGVNANFENRLILLSDGMANRGVTDREQIIEDALELIQEGVGLTTIGVGESFDPTLMKGLAEAAGGTYYFADNQQALEEIFVEEARAFIVPVGYEVTIDVQAGAHYELRASYGANQFELTTDRRTGKLVLPAVTLAHRQAHDDNENGRRGGGSALIIEVMPAFNPMANYANTPEELHTNTAMGRATLTYKDAETQQTYAQTINLDYPHGPDVMLPDGYWTHDAIQKNFVMMNLYVGFQLAVVDYHSGNADVALADLDSLLAAAEAWNVEIGDEDIADDLRIGRLLRDAIAAEGAEPGEEPTDPWPQD